MRLIRGAMALAATGLLAACSGGGDGGGGGGDDDLSYVELRNLAVEINEDVAGLGGQTDAADLPTDGSATYQGVGAFDTDPDERYSDPETVARLELEAEFGDGTIGGRLFDFENEDGDDIDGELQITGGIDGGDSTFEADVGGELTGEGVTATYTNGTLEGAFYGPEAEGIFGIGQATRTIDGAETTVYGVIYAN